MHIPAAERSLLALARSFLFLPANRLERLDKALSSGAHAVILDLEDAVAPEEKAAARDALAQRWSHMPPQWTARLLLRLNAPATDFYADDLALLARLNGLGAVMPAKSESVAQLLTLQNAAGPIPLLPLIESAEGLAQIDPLARHPAVLRLAFGHLDFQADLGMACDEEEAELHSVRLSFVLASRRAQLAPPVDGVTTALQDEARLQADTQRARRLGFSGKLCIHPQQVSTVNAALGPTAPELAWAKRVLLAAQTHGTGAFRFEGKMVDPPVLALARRLQASAQ